MKVGAALAVTVAIAIAQSERPAPGTVTAVRHWSQGEVTRVAVEISGDFHFVTERLHNPERVYFDIPDARPRFDTRRLYNEQFEDPLLKRIRVAETLPSVTRVVLDLGPSVEISTSQLTNPNRLIIELRHSLVPTITEAPPPVRTEAKAPDVPPAVAKLDTPKPPRPLKPLNTDTLPPANSAPSTTALPDPPAAVEPSRTSVAKVERLNKVATELPRPEKPAPPPVESVRPEKVATTPSTAPETNLAVETGKAAHHTTNGETSLVRALGLKIGRVVIDPGHGGHDQGTQGAHGLLEKDVVLDVALRVGKLIQDRLGAEVIYTRTDDTFVPLEGRTALANEKRADLFLSIHANSSPVPRISGTETYYLNFTEAKDALDVAGRENASSQKSVFELQDIIQQITLHNKAEESRDFAGRLQHELYTFSSHYFPAVKNRGVKKAPFVVLIGATMPSVLAEIGFLSNTREEALLKKPDYRQKLAEALFHGISHYADSLSHFQVAHDTAPKPRPTNPEEH